MAENHSPETILQEALDLADFQGRAAYLDEACGDDRALRQEVESLLAAHFAANSDFMDTLADSVLQEAPTEKEGDCIGRYKLLQQIGEGGFGTVYLAEQTEPVKRRVALKVIKAGMDSNEVIARFEAERQALALMDHPNIAQVHDAGTTEGGRPYFVMELVKGVPLTKYCTDKELNTKARLELFTDVCAAVQHAHQKGIIHRDLKPSNILVSPHDGKPVVKVIDFGIAKAIGMELTEKTVFTQLGRMIGTPQYMSPEQAELNALDVDTRSDIYSLGVVLYELLTGTTPLDGTKLRSAAYGEMQRMIREETPQKPSTKLSESLSDPESSKFSHSRISPHSLRGDLDWIVLKALEKDRVRRYETANALALDVGRHLRDEPVVAGPPSAGYRMKKFVRRNRRALLSGTAAAVALLVGLTVAGGVWLNASLKESQRLAEVEGKAFGLIEQAERLMEQNALADYDDDSHFLQAVNLAQQLDSLLEIEAAGEEVRERSDGLLSVVASERRDRQLIHEIEEAVMMDMGTGRGGYQRDMSAIEAAYAQSFQQHGGPDWEQPGGKKMDWVAFRREDVRDRFLAGMVQWAVLLEEKSPKTAERLKANVAELDPDSSLVELLRAIDKKDRAALEELAESEEFGGQPVQVVLSLAWALQRAGSGAAMETVLRRVQRDHPDSFWTNIALGLALAKGIDPDGWVPLEGRNIATVTLSGETRVRSEFDEAIGFLRAAVATRPDATWGWINLGMILTQQGNFDDAVVYSRRAVELKPKWAVVHSNLGSAHMNRGEIDEAITSLERAIALDPNLAIVHSNLGNALDQHGEFDRAAASCRRAIALDPSLAIAHLNLGNALDHRREVDGAIASYRSAIQLDSKLVRAHHYLGDALRRWGELDQAIASCRRAIALDPKSAAAHNSLGIALVDSGEIGGGIESYGRAIALDPGLAEAHNNLGTALYQQGKGEEAITSYRKAIELNSAEAHHNLGNVLTARDKLDEAIASYHNSIELDPDNASVHSALGNVLKRQEKFDEAIAAYRKAIEQDPKLAGAHYNLANTLRDEGNLDEAIASYRRTIAVNPKLAIAHTNLGNVLKRQGKLDEAIVSHRKAIAQDPEDAMAHHNLGSAYLRARRDRQPVVKGQPTSRDRFPERPILPSR